jgi:hypothetical protein
MVELCFFTSLSFMILGGIVVTNVLVRRNGEMNEEIKESTIVYLTLRAMSPTSRATSLASREYNWKSRRSILSISHRRL